jgi:hypothetical protein
MIRFLPDTWLDVVMRPLDMAAPEANSYVEIAAPDIRLAAAMFLAVAVLLVWRRRAGGGAAPVLWLLLLLAISMAIWLDTTGNGRYFIVWLVLLGPLCIGLVRLLPIGNARKLVLGGSLVGLQLLALAGNSPWGSWTWVQWKDPPYFQIEKPPQEPATYVTIANISYSLLAPQFPPGSRWVGLGGGVAPRDRPLVDKILSTSPNLVLLAPALPAATLDNGQPGESATQALGRLLQPHGLSLKVGAQCRHLASEGMLRLTHRKGDVPPETAGKHGFWLCPIEFRPEGIAAPKEVAQPVRELFETMERMCPRFFAGSGAPMAINSGWLKTYDSDTKIYLMDDGKVYYKFWRSLSAVEVGTRDDVVAGRATVDCANIRAPNWRRGGP